MSHSLAIPAPFFTPAIICRYIQCCFLRYHIYDAEPSLTARSGKAREASQFLPPTMSPDAMLHWRDHHALQMVVHVVVESALARISDDAVAGVLDEIRQAVSEALDSHDFVKAAMRPTTPSGCPELLSAAVQSPANFETDASAPEPPRRESWIEVPTARSTESSKVLFSLATPSASPEVPRRDLDLSPESPPSAPSPSASPSRSLAERLDTPPVNK
ncbi:hypothetical protein EXIGLDRAFT_253393 [Exidia glandulosa HHB12029]|uniref:Uncharacterized protein n=1 Tax=Exidia glandulosa HHB12029 TaxID=1314781 RepID=A0A165DXL3_EXIGL|nr:hypothetical protein EXIGLDRAFT_253393 [Exidia glandulosa HHB12029]